MIVFNSHTAIFIEHVLGKDTESDTLEVIRVWIECDTILLTCNKEGIAGYNIELGESFYPFLLQHVFDYQPGEKFGCVADIGWVTGHSYVLYGPLSNGATTLIFESTPIYPDAGEMPRFSF